MMKTYIIILLFSAGILSCTKTYDIQGVWKCTFVDTQILGKSNIIFEDLELFEIDYFEPIFEFYDDKLRYDLGFGSNDFGLDNNYCEYNLSEGLINFNCSQKNHVLSIEHKTDDKFCIFLEGEKMACFVKLINNRKSSNEDYIIDFEIINDLYHINLKMPSDGIGVISRKGEVNDTTNFSLNQNDLQYIESLVQHINSSNFKMENKNIGGDHARYSLRLKSNSNNYIGEVEGLNGVSFETKALIVNLENLIISTFSPKK